MRILLLSFALLSSSIPAFSPPKSPATTTPTVRQPIRISLVNMSGRRRQVLLKNGTVDLPMGQRMDIDTCVGATLHIVSETNPKFHEDLKVKPNDDVRMITIS
jgi:hypothetical protein